MEVSMTTRGDFGAAVSGSEPLAVKGKNSRTKRTAI
jgi:hypothetical protein